MIQALLYGCALGQLFVAGLNLCLPRILDWREPLAAMPLLVRQVFHMHSFFISMTCAAFAVMTAWVVVDGGAHARVVAGCIGSFWLLRTLAQVFYYSSEHWRGQRSETVIHFVLLMAYGGMAALYLWVAAGAAVGG